MKQINYNAETGETIVDEVADVEMPIIEEMIDEKAIAYAAIGKATTVASLRNAMLNYIEVSGVN